MNTKDKRLRASRNIADIYESIEAVPFGYRVVVQINPHVPFRLERRVDTLDEARAFKAKFCAEYGLSVSREV